MNYIVYITEGYTELPAGNEVENCQIVNFVENSHFSRSEVLEHTATELNLRQDKMNALGYVDETHIEAIRRIINYLWDDEEKHYEEAGNKNGHIYEDIKMLAEYIGR